MGRPVVAQAAPVATPPARHLVRSWNPIGEKHIELSGLFRMPVRHPDEGLPVRREHREAVEARCGGDAFFGRAHVQQVGGALGLQGDYAGPASVRFFADIAKFAKQAYQGDFDEGFWKALNNVTGTLLHYPSGQINATIDGIDAIARGRTQNPGALLVGSNKN